MREPAIRKRGRRGSPESWSVDAHVGQRVRMRRTLLGMSQEKLGEAIGLTFQQVQKYERGSNRISAGTLYRLGQVLDVPVSFFFDCYDDPHGRGHRANDSAPSSVAENAISRREARLLRLWRAASPAIADEILSLLGSLSPNLPETGSESRPESGDDDVRAVPVPADVPRADLSRTEKRIASRGDGTRVKADPGKGAKRRRRHGAVWDPSDIYRAAKAPTRTEN